MLGQAPVWVSALGPGSGEGERSLGRQSPWSELAEGTGSLSTLPRPEGGCQEGSRREFAKSLRRWPPLLRRVYEQAAVAVESSLKLRSPQGEKHTLHAARHSRGLAKGSPLEVEPKWLGRAYASPRP